MADVNVRHRVRAGVERTATGAGGCRAAASSTRRRASSGRIERATTGAERARAPPDARGAGCPGRQPKRTRGVP